MEEIERDVIFFDESGGGVTCSGGEPLMQPEFLSELLVVCRAHRLHTAVETCGLAPRAVLDDIARHVDLFLYDVKELDTWRHLRATGASNHLILDNLRYLSAHHPNVRVRVPLIPGVNDDLEHLRALAEFLVSLHLTTIDLLPYHRAGIAKYERLDRPYALHHIRPPSSESLEAARLAMSAAGLAVHIGGS